MVVFIFVGYGFGLDYTNNVCMVRKQVDLVSETQPNRYGLPAGIYAEGITRTHLIKNQQRKDFFDFYYCLSRTEPTPTKRYTAL